MQWIQNSLKLTTEYGFAGASLMEHGFEQVCAEDDYGSESFRERDSSQEMCGSEG